MAKAVKCGVVITDGTRILLGHATRSPRWDIPKGLVEPGETHVAAAIRELAEETGLVVGAAELRLMGVHAYLRGKDLALFAWHRDPLPDQATLVCRSTFTLADGTVLPEFDRFAALDWDAAFGRIGTKLARVLRKLFRP